jgi:hypothetical protein
LQDERAFPFVSAQFAFSLQGFIRQSSRGSPSILIFAPVQVLTQPADANAQTNESVSAQVGRFAGKRKLRHLRVPRARGRLGSQHTHTHRFDRRHLTFQFFIDLPAT